MTDTPARPAPVATKRITMPAGWGARKLSEKNRALLGGMNREQRRAWAKKAENRKGF